MQMVIFMIAVILLLAAAVEIYRTRRMCMFQRSRIEELREKVREAQKRLDSGERQLFDAVNTIHLYAALSEEEAGTQELKQKQREIQKISEEMIRMYGGQKKTYFGKKELTS